MSSPQDSRDSMEYIKPEIVDYGNLVELTAGSAGGSHLDAAFPSGTAYGDLTFSTP